MRARRRFYGTVAEVTSLEGQLAEVSMLVPPSTVVRNALAQTAINLGAGLAVIVLGTVGMTLAFVVGSLSVPLGLFAGGLGVIGAVIVPLVGANTLHREVLERTLRRAASPDVPRALSSTQSVAVPVASARRRP